MSTTASTITSPDVPVEIEEQPSSMRVEDFDVDRDVLLDMMDNTLERRIYRQVLERWVPRYRYVKRGEKRKVVERIVGEMRVNGVRFWNRDITPGNFGLRAKSAPPRKVIDRVQRCLRDASRKRFGGNGSVRSGTTTASSSGSGIIINDNNNDSEANVSLAPSGASDGSTIRTKETAASTTITGRTTFPVTQVRVPTTTTTSSPRKVVTAKESPVPTEVVAKSSRTATAGSDVSSIHEVSVATTTAAEAVPAPFPSETAWADTTMDVPAPTDPLTYPEESWSSTLFRHCMTDFQSLMQDGDGVDVGTNEPFAQGKESDVHGHLEAAVVSPVKRSRDSLLMDDDNDEDTKQEPVSQRRRLWSDRVPTTVATSWDTTTTTPVWVHLSRHLAVLERRLEFVEQDNADLRRRVAMYEGHPTLDETLHHLVSSHEDDADPLAVDPVVLL